MSVIAASRRSRRVGAKPSFKADIVRQAHSFDHFCGRAVRAVLAHQAGDQ